MDNYKTAVTFRIFHGEVLALFPYDIYNHTGLVNSYMHVGQHSGAVYDHCIQSSKKATEEQYRSLKRELESIGYNLKIITRRHYGTYLTALKKLRR